MAASCSAMGKTALPCHYLAPPTSVRPGLRLNGPSNRASRHRLGKRARPATRVGGELDRSDKALHPSQVAISRPSTSQKRETSKLGGIIISAQ